MASFRDSMASATVMQNAASGTGNGTALATKGASRAIIFIKSSAALSTGQVIVEKSTDAGQNWAAATSIQDIASADTAADVSTINFGSFPVCLKVNGLEGDSQLRARIATAPTGGTITVLGAAVLG